MNQMNRWRLVATLCATFALSACVYSIDIQQGNFLEQKDLDRVAVGMTRVQVRSLLGTPMVSDPFEGARWDYVYYYKSNRTREVVQRNFIVFFEGDKVSRVESSNQQKDATTAATQPAADPPAASEPSATEPAANPPTATQPATNQPATNQP